MAHAEIADDAILDRAALKKSLGLTDRAIRAAVRAGELRESVRVGRRWYRGADVLRWLFREGEAGR
ncbi:hypothetical protein Pan216_12700 [Planctomycetes bacterium Pan216]|uniref:Helix-turn-helix domain protein n=1 Tax=Kolteria novifilia TaxID=2527975 RepID=A0A518B0D6_9BACT|nr:hypothetical protein Pan216_12700 [Planctomycetes bacterium Pan216]